MQEHINSTISKLIDEIRNLNGKFKRLKSDVEVGKKSERCPAVAGSFP